MESEDARRVLMMVPFGKDFLIGDARFNNVGSKLIL